MHGSDLTDGEARMQQEMAGLRPAHDGAIRVATAADIPGISLLMERSISELQRAFLDPAQIEASRMLMGLDTQLIEDGTYYVLEIATRLAGCGGWSMRATQYGGDVSPGRDAALLDPAEEPARIRAMYTDPDFARQGVGRRVLAACEGAARAAGFTRAMLVATLAGEPLYQRCGYEQVERFEDPRGGVPVPLVRMIKRLGP